MQSHVTLLRIRRVRAIATRQSFVIDVQELRHLPRPQHPQLLRERRLPHPHLIPPRHDPQGVRSFAGLIGEEHAVSTGPQERSDAPR